jgi:hypothetical protein
MKFRRLALLIALTSLGILGTVGVAPAAATPIWNLDIHHNETNFPPGGNAEYRFDVDNVGDTASSGTTTLSVDLPAGLTRDSVRFEIGGAPVAWNCPGSSGDSHLTCTTTSAIPRHELSRGLVLTVNVGSDPGLDGQDLTTTATISGGGAPDAPAAAGCAPGVGACAFERTHVSSTPASFGILADSLNGDFYEADGVTPVRQSGAHPDNLAVSFDLNSISHGLNSAGDPQKSPADNIRHLTVDLPPGFVGNPTAVGECTPAQFTLNLCPASSQVGRADLAVSPLSTSATVFYFTNPVYNITHPLGAITDLGFSIAGNPVHIKVSLDPSNNYSIRSTVNDINESLPAFSSKVTIWGVPADPSHDSERCRPVSGSLETSASCPTDPRGPFLTAPFDCGADNSIKLSGYDSWQNPGVFGPDLSYRMPGRMTGCDAPRFAPDVSVNPTGQQANTPTGLDVHIKVPQNGNPDALASPPVKSTVVTLPRGMTLSPSFADGLDGCSQAQIGLGTNDPVACPDNSRIGDVSITTPLLPNPVVGSMYLAKQNDNPFGTTFALYMAVHDTEDRGALIKIPGKVELDPQTGQITTSFDDLPEFPFSDFTLSFRSGDRAPLVSPPDCGSHSIAVKVASYAQPNTLVDASNTYNVTQGPGGGACPPDAAHRPFAPKLNAGTLNPVAGSYSSFIFRLSRTDSDQEISQVRSILPPGLVAKIAGIPFCSDAAIAAIPTAEETGQSEFSSPHCPSASQIGTINTGVGSGNSPNYFSGKVYLAGPYQGDPLSLVTVVPALAGPYDLGNVVVRAAIHVDPDTSRVTALSDPFPTILHGVLLRIRDIRLKVDRPETTINPTNCSPMSVNGFATGVGGDLLSTADDFQAALSNPFQVGDCGRLGFGPKLNFRLRGGTHRGDYPAFSSRLLARKGDANIRKAIVALPHSEFLANAHIRTICTRVQFAADQCPAASVYGYAKAITPLLDQPVEGPVILRSSNHTLPDLVAKLRGQIAANLVGRIDSVHGGIRANFESVPDVPVTEFILNMQGGKKGLFVNSRNLCKAPSRADVRFTAQNGKTLHLRPRIQNGCKRTSHGSRQAHRRHR